MDLGVKLIFSDTYKQCFSIKIFNETIEKFKENHRGTSKKGKPQQYYQIKSLLFNCYKLAA